MDLVSLLYALRLAPQLQGLLNTIQAPQPAGQQAEQLGYLPGAAQLNPQTAPAVPADAARPFGPGEYLQNPDGSWSNERTMTVAPGEAPELMGGKATVIPRLWIFNGKPYFASEDQATEFAINSGLSFQTFESGQAAEDFAAQRETNWQKIEPQNSGSVTPLWTQPKPKGP